MSDDPSSSPVAATHWCYHCNKSVAVETLDEFVVCCECNKGFVESILPNPSAPPPQLSPDLTVEHSSIGSHFFQMLRLLAHGPSQRSPPHLDVLSYLDEDEDDDEEEEDDLSVNEEEEEEEEVRMRNEGEIFPLTTSSRTGRNRILDWAEILMGIEENTMETGEDGALLDGRRGARPAAKSAIEALESFEVSSSSSSIVVCAVCKDEMVMGEIGKKLPCGHCYHGFCIVPWLATRNSCPVCRFQLHTDDPAYEEEERNTFTDSASSSSSSPF